MRIVVNSIPAKGLVTGIGRYVRSLYSAILRYKDLNVTFFDGITCERIIPSYTNHGKYIAAIDCISGLPWWALMWARAIYWLIFEKRLKGVLKKVKASVYHETSFFPAGVSLCSQVFTIYDLSLIKIPQLHPMDRVAFFRLFFERRLPFAHHVVTISEFVKNEITDLLNLPPHKITVTPLAPSENFYPRSSSAVEEVMRKYNITRPFIISVGSIDPRKNLGLILRAFDLINRKDVTLVIIGWKGWGSGELEEILRRLKNKEKVKLLGYIPDNDLAALYGGACCLVYPSLYEGFGLPVVEAMACGCPVVCSSTSSLPETAGNAAMFVDPYSHEDLAESITVLLENEPLRKHFIHLGFSRVAEFSWEKTAEITLRLFYSLV